jgi:hypothetical protein
MENILSNGFFWSFLTIALVVVVGYYSNRPEKTDEKPA